MMTLTSRRRCRQVSRIRILSQATYKMYCVSWNSLVWAHLLLTSFSCLFCECTIGWWYHYFCGWLKLHGRLVDRFGCCVSHPLCKQGNIIDHHDVRKSYLYVRTTNRHARRTPLQFHYKRCDFFDPLWFRQSCDFSCNCCPGKFWKQSRNSKQSSRQHVCGCHGLGGRSDWIDLLDDFVLRDV